MRGTRRAVIKRNAYRDLWPSRGGAVNFTFAACCNRSDARRTALTSRPCFYDIPPRRTTPGNAMSRFETFGAVFPADHAKSRAGRNGANEFLTGAVKPSRCFSRFAERISSRVSPFVGEVPVRTRMETAFSTLST